MIHNSIVRNADVRDLPAILDIYNAYIGNGIITADTVPVTVEERMPWFKQHNPDARPLWVMELGGEIAAWISLSDFYGRPAYRSTAEVSIYIAEKYRGKGIGKFLMKKMVNACPKLQVETLLGFIFRENQASLKLFAHFGFEEWGSLPKVAELGGRMHDLLIVGKKV
ncbi:N-acetyltransferase [Weizmannia acidilactici]|uniref:GNAT family N-acetyltransferase n=1 Tax=Weizmannia acidilactici TaxID=2607726 RepID=UPI00124C49DC|nr:GNAT family N-acetyltransferase [Weizmannia acidilactici]GER66615.1 N-acetyltransferase [Weizmannia acidilactici]